MALPHPERTAPGSDSPKTMTYKDKTKRKRHIYEYVLGRKVCSCCGEEKSTEAFYRNCRNRGGASCFCKDCHNARMSEYRATNPDKIKMRRVEYACTSRAAELGRIRLTRYRLAHPERKSAQMAAKRAVAAGLLATEPCAACGSVADLQKHHEDYGKPFDNIWLCRRCHTDLHRKDRL